MKGAGNIPVQNLWTYGYVNIKRTLYARKTPKPMTQSRNAKSQTPRTFPELTASQLHCDSCSV